MRLSDILSPGCVVLRPDWGSFEGTVRGLIGALVAEQRLSNELTDAVVRAVCEREELSSTSFVEISVSIPHARIEGVKDVTVALAASPASLYPTEAGVSISITALVLSPPARAAEHLNVLSTLSLLLQSESLRDSIRDAEDGNEVVAVLRSLERP